MLKKWQEKLNGREYRAELTKEEEKQLKEEGVVVVFGASDDLIEFRGAIDDEIDCYVAFNSSKKFLVFDTDEDMFLLVDDEELNHNGKYIKVLWDKDNISWQYKICGDVEQHETFNIFEDKSIYCKGIIFKLRDFKKENAEEKLNEILGIMKK